jgi:hypothetical protein
MAQVVVSVQLLSVDIADNGQITAYFSDSPQTGHVYQSISSLEEYLSHEGLWLPTLRAMALLDYTQESIVGKTVTMSCADPNDLWVKAI